VTTERDDDAPAPTDGEERPYNAADPVQVKERKLSAKRREQRRVAEFRNLMSELAGRRFVWAILSRAGVFRISHQAGDPFQTAFREGERNVGNWLLADINAICPDLYAAMVAENREGA
jgi:hypothetical protein